MNIYTTLAEILAARPCQEGWETLVKSLPKGHKPEDPISILHVLESNGVDDAEWALRKCPSLGPLNDDYQAKLKSIEDDYWAKLKPIDDDYWAKRNVLEDDYDAKLKPIVDDYRAKREAIDADYWAKLKPIDDDYRAKCKALLIEIATEAAK